MYPVRRQTSPHAARLRCDRTEAEDRLWQVIRNRQLAGYKFRFQASLFPYVADLLCVEARLIVEIDGGQHSEADDAARTAVLEARGYRVIRFWNNDVLGNLEGVAHVIRQALVDQKKTLTQPSPAKAGEG
jgi:very-short-patch-repair endonuclease